MTREDAAALQRAHEITGVLWEGRGKDELDYDGNDVDAMLLEARELIGNVLASLEED